MTVASEAYFGQMTWTGPETSFNPGFSAEKAADVSMTATATDGTVTTLTQGIHYTVAIGANNAVSITLITAALPAAPQTLTAVRGTAALQGIDFQDLEDFSADDHELLHDRWARLAAERKGDDRRALRVPLGETIVPIPSATVRANRVLGFDATGAPVAASSTEDIIGTGPGFIYSDPVNGLVPKAITPDDLPLAQNAAIGAVRAKPFEEHKWVQYLGQDGWFVLAQPAAGDLVPGFLEESVPMSADRVYHILRAPGDPLDGFLRRIWIGNDIDPAVYLRSDVIHFGPANVASPEYGFMSTSGLQNFLLFGCTIDGDDNTIRDLKTSQFAAGQVREKLAANKSLFVNTATGSDTNNGLTAGTAFKTINKAIQVAAQLDGGGTFLCVVNVAAGTYAESVACLTHLCSLVSLVSTTPGAAIIQPAAGICIAANSVRGLYRFTGFKTIGPSDQIHIYAQRGSQLDLYNHDFGAAPGFGVHVQAASQASILFQTAVTISGGAFVHWNALTNSSITAAGIPITLTGAPAFTGYFAQATQSAVIACGTITWTYGGATGTRYRVATNAAIDTGGAAAGESYLPGTVNGTTASGGVYA